MLERAAGCLENAGRRFFRDSNGAIRHSRSLYPQLGQNHTSIAELPHWLLAFVQASDQRAARTSSAPSNGGRTARDTRTPFLDFLYPPPAQGSASSLLSHPARRLVSRRRRRPTPGFSRTYASKAASRQQTPEEEQVEHNVLDGESERSRAKGELEAMLGQGELVDYEQAWTLYTLAGRPSDVNSTLLALLCRSGRRLDHRRMRGVFHNIPIAHRSADDYLYMLQSCFVVGSSLDTNVFTYVKELCQEAVSNGAGTSCLGYAFATSMNTAQWSLAEEVWNLKPKHGGAEALENEWLLYIVSRVDLPSFLNNALQLATFFEKHKNDNTAFELARVLIYHAFSSLQTVEDIPYKRILGILRKYHKLNILTAEHFFQLIESYRSSEFRATFIRSIVIYRHFRWQMPEEVPPARLIGAMIRSLTSHEITNGVLYFLEEFAHFHEKPTVDAYKHALITFSRIGDVSKVYELFERLVSHHGKPRSRRLLSPLLYVNARVGNVLATQKEFERIPNEFGLELNTVCWNILLTAHANANDMHGCLGIFQQMLENEVELNAHSFGILMGLCANRGDIDNVHRLLAMVRERKMQVTAPLLDTIVESYCRNGRFDMAESVAQTCLGMDVKGSRIRMWNILLWHYSFRIDLDAISRVRSRMQEANLQPDGMTYAALMLNLVLIGKTHSARRIFRTLHRNKRVQATEFHYTIILYGYVRERNRDMVHIIFREIQNRFERPGSSSSLLFLKSQLQRDLQLISTGGAPMETAAMRLENAEKFLAETIADFDPTKLATKEPMPATGRQSAIEAFPGMFYEYVMNAYGTRGASAKVRELFDQFTTRQEPLGAVKNVNDIAPLRLLNTLMHTHLRADQYKEVEECWQMAFPRAVKLATPINTEEWISESLPSVDNLDPPRPALPESAQNILVAPETWDVATSKRSPILPSLQFALSRPLSLYMRSLAYRNEISRIPQIVAEVQSAGFSLTTFNWSTYVQMLASSDKPSDYREAFTVFEQKFMPNFPGWDYLVRGLNIKPAEVPPKFSEIEDLRKFKLRNYLGKRGRRYWSKIQPDFMQPTYISMVYLAAALNTLRDKSIVGGDAELLAVFSAAPKTVEALGSMPYLREKFQGVLLRSRQQQGDKTRIPGAYEPYVWTGGLLGVGGRHRAPVEVLADEARAEAESDLALDQITADAKSQYTGGSASGVEDSPPQKTLDPQDEHEIETEANLEAARGRYNPDNESQRAEQAEEPRQPEQPENNEQLQQSTQSDNVQATSDQRSENESISGELDGTQGTGNHEQPQELQQPDTVETTSDLMGGETWETSDAHSAKISEVTEEVFGEEKKEDPGKQNDDESAS